MSEGVIDRRHVLTFFLSPYDEKDVCSFCPTASLDSYLREEDQKSLKTKDEVCEDDQEEEQQEIMIMMMQERIRNRRVGKYKK